MKIETHVHINAPVEQVFDIFSDIQGAEDRLAGIKSIEILSEQVSGKDLKWKETRVLFGKEATEIMWITEFDDPHMYAVEAESNGMKYRTVFEFKKNENNSTDVHSVFTGEPQTMPAKLMGLLTWMFSGATKKALQKDMDDLKQYIEHENSLMAEQEDELETNHGDEGTEAGE